MVVDFTRRDMNTHNILGRDDGNQKKSGSHYGTATMVVLGSTLMLYLAKGQIKQAYDYLADWVKGRGAKKLQAAQTYMNDCPIRTVNTGKWRPGMGESDITGNPMDSRKILSDEETYFIRMFTPDGNFNAEIPLDAIMPEGVERSYLRKAFRKFLMEANNLKTIDQIPGGKDILTVDLNMDNKLYVPSSDFGMTVGEYIEKIREQRKNPQLIIADEVKNRK